MVPTLPSVDLPAAEAAVRDLLVALGVDVEDEHLAETPHRVARAYADVLTPEPFDLTTFANADGDNELVLVTGIPFQSLCAHHLLPFHGVAHVGYLPSGRIVGLSKLARIVQRFAAAPQVQERLTREIVDCITEHLAPEGVGVIIEAEHECMSLRGVQARGTRTTTSCFRGTLRDDPAARAEMLALVRSGG
jgi:GTP cyclohydrolase I